ncbi:MAG: hypothetical protein KGI67_15865, partial [Pseudomonadota bacterium]|nr:hypothetical protein [Pseudomonadota bacterium]
PFRNRPQHPHLSVDCLVKEQSLQRCFALVQRRKTAIMLSDPGTVNTLPAFSRGGGSSVPFGSAVLARESVLNQ